MELNVLILMNVNPIQIIVQPIMSVKIQLDHLNAIPLLHLLHNNHQVPRVQQNCRQVNPQQIPNPIMTHKIQKP